jgi:hypothetical protein
LQLYKTCFYIRSCGRVARQSSAKASTAVRIRSGPRKLSSLSKMRGLFIMRIPKILHWLGLIACIALIASCFMSWTYYPDIDKTFTGFFSEQNEYGKPAVFFIPIALISFILTIVPKLWTKRANLFLCALGVGYAVKSYIVYTGCYGAFCPEKKIGIYVMLSSALMMLIAAIFPDVDMNENK